MSQRLRAANALALFSALGLLLSSPAPAAGQSKATVPTGVDTYNYVLGTQTIDGAYQFTTENRLVETARAIQAMGSTTIKFSLGADEVTLPKNLIDAARNSPSVKAVFGMPFARYVLWAYPLSVAKTAWFQQESLAAEYGEMYDLTRYLLQTYSTTSKTFMLGNWEGDWHLTHLDPNYGPSEEEVAAMIAWVNNRQRAVDDAKRDTPHHGVEVYLYLEVNRVVDAMQGKARMTNRVLPRTNVDFVSYSSYDALSGDIESNITKSLDYIESQLPAKPNVNGKRVFIGEYGFTTDRNSPEEQDAKSRSVMRAALRWGCPHVLYWEFYNNEVRDGKQRGFWMVDDHNVKQPIFSTHERFYRLARQWVGEFEKRYDRLPLQAEFNRQAVSWLDPSAARPPAEARR
ncbi:MAG TPA: hypothetical protein VHE78_06015 [Gemmatimonadaceae bacterium]|nr:hypothetical protein [Gemmatimonadaceae bacterium]